MTGHNEQWQPRLPVGARLAALNGERWIVREATRQKSSGRTIYRVRRPYLVPPPGATVWDAELTPLEFTMSEEYLLDIIHSYSMEGEGDGTGVGILCASSGESPAVLPGTPGEDGRRAERGEAVDRRGARHRAGRLADWGRGSTTARTHLGGRRQRAESAAGIIRKRAKARRAWLRWIARLAGVMVVLLGCVGIYWGVTGLMSSLRVVQVVGGLLAVVAGLCLVTVPGDYETKRSRPRQRKKTP